MKKPRKLTKNIKKFIKTNCKEVLMALLALVLVLTAIKGGLYFIDKYSVYQVTNDNIPYPIRGVDVSHYQGNIEWDQIKDQGISFAFIKATEGTDFVDDHFKRNWRKSHRAHLKRGAYHFYRIDEDPVLQAKNFTKTVPKKKNALPPVLDFEAHGQFHNNPPRQDKIIPNLKIFLNILEEKYQVKPIIYCNRYYYNKYISGNFDNPIWIADPTISPSLPDGAQWEFLQYSFHGKLKGYDGIEHIDLNVFRASRKDYWQQYY